MASKRSTNLSERSGSNGVFLDQRIIAIFIGGLILGGVIGSLYQKVKITEKSGTVTKNDVQGTDTADEQIIEEEPQTAELVINDTDPFLGKKDAKVTLVVFSDFLCPFCAALSGKSNTMVEAMKSRDANWMPAMPDIVKDYVDSGKARFVWKDLPFHGEPAIIAHAAARCANEQGKFWEYHDLVFSQHDKEGEDSFSVENLKKLAAELNLKTDDFNSCVDEGKYKEDMQDALNYGQKVGVNGTPATYINGKLISGAASYSTFKDAIEEALNQG